MELSPIRDANSCAATQEIPSIFVEPEVSLPLSKKPSTCPYPVSDKSSPHNHIPSLQDKLIIVLIIKLRGLSPLPNYTNRATAACRRR
jgi:hypothetical protein